MLEQSSFLSAMDETWRAVPGYEGRYEVSDRGRVRSLRFKNNRTDRQRTIPRILAGGVHSRTRYWNVSLAGATRLVHRLVLEAFVGPCPPGMEASHLNGQPQDNRLENLTWETHTENQGRQRAHGTMVGGDRAGARRHPERLSRGDAHYARTNPERLARGERVGGSKLTPAQVLEIRAVGARRSIVGLARRYGVCVDTIQDVITRHTWRHLP